MTQHDSPQSLEDICVAKGMRMTEQRRIIARVIEFRNEEIERLQEAIARKLGYRLVDHRLELYGIPLGGQPVDAGSEPGSDTDGEAG